MDKAEKLFLYHQAPPTLLLDLEEALNNFASDFPLWKTAKDFALGQLSIFSDCLSHNDIGRYGFEDVIEILYSENGDDIARLLQGLPYSIDDLARHLTTYFDTIQTHILNCGMYVNNTTFPYRLDHAYGPNYGLYVFKKVDEETFLQECYD